MPTQGFLATWRTPFRRPTRQPALAPSGRGPGAGAGGGGGGGAGGGRSRRPSDAIPDPTMQPAATSRLAQVAWRLAGLVQWLMVAGILITIGYQDYYIFFRAGYFRIQKVVVSGTHALSTPAVIALSGLELGDLVFEYDYDRVRSRLMMGPRVQDARVRVVSPNVVELAIVEKTPVLRVVDGTRHFEIDSTGAVLGPEETAKALPLVTGARVVTTGEGPALDEAQTELLAECFTVLSASALADFTAIDLISPFKVSVQWHGMKVLMADPANFERNAPLVKRILGEARDRGKDVEALDLRFSNIIVRFASQGGGAAPDSTQGGASDKGQVAGKGTAVEASAPPGHVTSPPVEASPAVHRPETGGGSPSAAPAGPTSPADSRARTAHAPPAPASVLSDRPSSRPAGSIHMRNDEARPAPEESATSAEPASPAPVPPRIRTVSEPHASPGVGRRSTRPASNRSAHASPSPEPGPPVVIDDETDEAPPASPSPSPSPGVEPSAGASPDASPGDASEESN